MSTFVLIHGAYQGGWIWKPVASRLRSRGHLVYAPSLDGCAERAHQLRPGITNATHGQEIAGLLVFEDLQDVVLVGTSIGAMVMTAAAELARERIGRLVFADPVALMDKESLRDVLTRANAVYTDLATGVTPEYADRQLLRDLDGPTRAWAAARLGLHPKVAMEGPVKLKTFWTQPWRASVIWCRRSLNPPQEHLRRAAAALGASWHELDTGHYPMLSMPDELTDLVLA